MNREILFRAKLKDDYFNKGWQYGLVYCTWFLGSIFKYWLTPIKKENLTTADTVCVNPETICEYTGITDKNGVKIFEGDIITFEDVCCEGGSGYEYPDEWAVEAMNRAEIIIRNGCVCFGKELFETSAYEDIQSYYPNLSEWFAECAEVIGNIYDNPELVKA